MNKINWINGQAGGTPLSAENLNQMQDNIEDAIDEVQSIAEKNIITATATATTSTAGINKEISVNDAIKVGNKLTVSNGKVVIGQGITKVKVSAKLLADTTELTTSFFYIRKNNNIINRSDGYGIYLTLSMPDLLVPVTQGDTISILANTGTNGTIYDGTYLTVEAVE